MKFFTLLPRPDGFDDHIYKPGQAWLAAHLNSKGRPHAYWTKWGKCRFHLADEFHNLCGYSLTYEPVGDVDHFISCEADRTKAYDWENYRYASGWINSCKQDPNAHTQLLDPFEIEDDWFEIILPSLQMCLVDGLEKRLPEEQYQRAKNTLEKLHLVNDDRVRKPRVMWYKTYLEGKITLDGLADFAPVLARAIRKKEQI